MRVLIPSYKADLPEFEPKPLGDTDVAVELNGNWYLVGSLAQLENPLAERMQHGDFSSVEMQLLARAAVAKSLGRGGSLVASLAISSPIRSIDRLRVARGDTLLQGKQLEHLRRAVAEINFRIGSTTAEVQTLQVEIDKAVVISELSAVIQTIPAKYQRFCLVQWGHGDLQMVCVDDGKVVGEPYSTTGLWSAVRHFQKISGLRPSQAQRAFLDGYRFNSSMGYRVDCAREIEQAIEHHVVTDMAAIMNDARKHDQRNVIVSGGTVHNSVAMRLLQQECAARQIELWRIHELDGVMVDDPVFSCLVGLREFGVLRFDLGHSAIKAEFGGNDEQR